MIIAVAGGKSGTGKTTVATSLALSLLGASDLPSLAGRRLAFVDGDVETPGASSLLHPRLTRATQVSVMAPKIDPELCTLCGRCAQACAYHALAVVRDEVLVFEELCNGCRSCQLVCPVEAIVPSSRQVGRVDRGRVGSMTYVQGSLIAGESLPGAVIREAKRQVEAEQGQRLVILDAAPGALLTLTETLRNCDYTLLVTEPSQFGLRDLQRALCVARDMLGLAVGVVINHDGYGDEGVDDFCRQERLPILARIPHDRYIAEAQSRGTPFVMAWPDYRQQFIALYQQIAEGVEG